MAHDEAAIQIDQHQARCQRCGKMINLRGSHLRARLRDGSEAMFCASICRDEFEELFGLADDAGRRSSDE